MPSTRVSQIEDEPYAPPGRRSPWTIISRVAVVATIIGLTLMWIYAFWGDPGVPGKLSELSYPRTVQPICQATRDRINALPKANTTPDHHVRAGVVDQGTDELEGMVAELGKNLPTAQPQHDMIVVWLDDWRTYLTDRREYTDRLRQDPMTRFYVTQSERDKVQITGALDRFAKINEMSACMIPGDLS